MTLTGTIKVWNGSAWVATVASGGGGGPDPDPTTTPYEDVVIADGPVAFWPLSESSGTVIADLSGNDVEAFLNGGTPHSGGPGGARYLELEAGNDYVNAGDNGFADTANWTAEAWVRPNDASGYHSILAHPAGFSGPYGYSLFTVDSTGLVRGEIDAGSGPSDRFSDSVITDNLWHHVVMTDDGTNTKIYVDGVLEDTTAESGTMSYTTGDFLIGAQSTSGGADYKFKGGVALVAIYDRALSGAEVRQHFTALVEPSELIERFTFEGGDTTGWTMGPDTAWSEAPADWITATGNGSGQTYLRRAMPVGTTYVEVDLYEDGTGSNWAAVRLHDQAGLALYDTGAYGVLVRGDGVIAANPWAGGTDHDDAGDLTGGDVASPDEAHTITLGFEIVDSANTNTYVNGVLRKHTDGQSDQTANGYLTIGCYNGASAHFREVRCYTAVPA